MPVEKYLLLNTPTVSERVVINADQSVVLVQELHFTLMNFEADDLKFFLEAVKADKSIQHAHGQTDDTYRFEYDPANSDLAKFVVTRQQNNREIAFGMSTAWRLLSALSGNTERLVKED